MAEPFSTAAAAIGVVDVLYRFGSNIKKVYKDSKTIDEDIDALIMEIEKLESCILSIEQVHLMHKSKSPGSSFANPVHIEDLWKHVSTVVDDCIASLSHLEKLVKDMVGSEKRPDRSKLAAKKDSFQKQRRKDDIMPAFEKERLRMATCQGHLQILLTSLTLSYTRSSQNSTDLSLGHLSQEVRKLSTTLASQIASQQGSSALANSGHFSAAIGSARAVAKLVSINQHFYIPQNVHSLFTGRELMLKNLQQYFDVFQNLGEHSNVQKRFVIYGTGGSGKTQFCSKFAQDNQDQFWGIFYIDASTPQNAESSFTRIAKIAGVEPTEGSNQRAAQDWLARQEQRWLLIIDNADDRHAGILQYFPDGKRGCILVTTRNPAYRIQGTVGTRWYNFEKLAFDEANDLLLKAAGMTTPWDVQIRKNAEPISEILGFLPIALLQAGAAIYGNLCSWADYIDHLQDEWDRLRVRRARLNRGSKEDEENPYVYPSYELNLVALEQSSDPLHIDAVQLLKLFSCFHFDNIRVDVLINAATNPRVEQEDEQKGKEQLLRFKPVTKSKTRTEQLKEKVTELPIFLLKDRGPAVLPSLLRDPKTQSLEKFTADLKHRLRRALMHLTNMSLIMRNENSDSYSMHPLWHRWIRERPNMSLAEQALWCQAARNTLTQCILLPPHASLEPEIAVLRDLLPHIEHARRCQEDLDKRLRENKGSQGLTLSSFVQGIVAPMFPHQTISRQKAEVMELAKYSRVYMECAKLAEAERLQLKVRDMVCKLLGRDNPRAMKIFQALALTYILQSRANDSAELQEHILTVYKHSLGPHHPDTHKIMDTLGATRCFQGRYRDSLALHEEAVRSMEATFKGKSREVLRGLEEASQRIQRIDQNTWEAAVEPWKAAVAALKGTSTTNLEDLFSAWGNKGRVLWRYFRYEEARQYFRKAAVGLLALLDITDRPAQEALQDLATSYLNFEGDFLGDMPEILDDAYAMLRTIHDQRKKTFGEEHPLSILAAAHIARVESCRKNHDEAERRFREIIPIVERTLGPKHFGSLAARAYLAQALIRHERYNEAQQELAVILPKHKFSRAARGDGNHPDHIVALWCQIRCYEGQNKIKEAFDHVKELEEVLGVIGGEGLGKKHTFAGMLEEKRLQLKAKMSQPQAEKIDSPMLGY